MELKIFEILIISLLLLLLGSVIMISVKMEKFFMIMGLNIMEPKKAPVVKEKKLKYNPSNLFNPYLYGEEEDLDPVIPELTVPKRVKKKKTEY